MTSARQIYLGSRRGPALPYDAEVEYIESTGTQWIDTGIHMKNGLVFDTEYTTLGKSVSSSAPFCCVYGAYNPQGVGIASVSSVQFYNAGGLGNRYMDKSIEITLANFRKRTIEHKGNDSFYLEYDGVRHNIGAFNSSQSAESPVSIWIFGIYYVIDSALTTPMRLYYFQIRYNGVLMLDLIPVRFTNEQGVSEGAMYDRVSGQLFRNAGTGAFNYGNDK